jgi:hypothetical protein
MKTLNKVLLLVGSAKTPGTSTSEALGDYLLERLAEHGIATARIHLHRAMRTEERCDELLATVSTAGLMVLATPLYVDTLPYLVTRAMEQIVAHRRSATSLSPVRFAAIINCGFPEAEHNQVALAVCRQFAQAARMEWAGGLAQGAGGMFNGQSLAEAGGRGYATRQALDLAAGALVTGLPIPDEATAQMAQPAIPAAVYTMLGNLGWWRTAWRHGAYRHLYDRPFAQGSS